MLSLALAVAYASSLVNGLSDRLSVRPIEEVTKDYGYPVERHEITTEDGYILTYHRVPHGRHDSGSTGPRRVVLFNNGIMLSSASTMVCREGIPYLLADAGFDVWLGNYRGNMYSRKHVRLDPDRDKQFWSFSLHELGTRDLPAAIDYILGKTGQQKLTYIGASMGTTMFWVLGASKPEYMRRIETMVAVAPVARPTHSGLVHHWARYRLAHAILVSLHDMGIREMFPYSEALSAVIFNSCSSSWLKPVCFRFLDIFNMLTSQNWDPNRLLEATKYGPSGVATQVAVHFLQIAHDRRFQQFDYGAQRNLQTYLTQFPPQYDLKNVDCEDIYFIHGDADQIAAAQDVEWLAQQLPKRPKRILSEVNHLGHVGLGLDKNIRDLWVGPLVEFLKHLPHQRTNDSYIKQSYYLG